MRVEEMTLRSDGCSFFTADEVLEIIDKVESEVEDANNS